MSVLDETQDSTPTRSPLWPAVISGVYTVIVLVLLIRGLSPATGAVVMFGPLLAVLVLLHPRLMFYGLAFVTAFAPYIKVPYTPIPLILVFAAGGWLALVIGAKGTRIRIGWLEWTMGLLALCAFASLSTFGLSFAAFQEYGAWLAPTIVALLLTYVSGPVLLRFGRVFVWGAAAGAVVGAVLVALDPNGLYLAKLTVVGYSSSGDNGRLVPGLEGANTLRLTSTYVEPNIAGLALLLGLILAVALFEGPRRIVLSVVIAAGLTLTLSRSAIGTIVVAAVLVLVTSKAARKVKIGILATGVVGVLVALLVPVVHQRLFNSFGAGDTGTNARVQAFQDFSNLVSGHWIFGLGWVRDEFREVTVGVTVNFVANTPLLTIYRGGLVTAIPFVILLIACLLRGWRVLRHGTTQGGILAAGLIAFILVALQLDFPVVTQSPATTVFAILIGFVAHPMFNPPPRSRPIEAGDG